MIWPPLGPGTLASMGAAVTSGVGAAVGTPSEAAAAWLADGAALGAADGVDPLQAATTMATMPASTSKARGPDRGWYIASVSSAGMRSNDLVPFVDGPMGNGRRSTWIGTRRSPAGSGHPPPGARRALDELGGQDHAAGRVTGTLDGLDQQAGHLLAHLLDRLSDAGERRRRRRRDRRVVETDHGHVVRDASSRAVERQQCAGGHQVRGREHRI